MIDSKFFAGWNGLRSLLLLVALVLFPVVLHADGGGSTAPGEDDPANASSPGDEVTSLPVVADPSGLTLVGARGEIRALVLSVEGRGLVHVQRLGRGRVAVTWMGDYRLQFDRRVLARGGVQVFFRGGRLYDGGMALLSIAGSEPMPVPAERVRMPAARLAASGFEGTGLALLVRGVNGHAARGAAAFGAQRVIWTQRLH